MRISVRVKPGTKGATRLEKQEDGSYRDSFGNYYITFCGIGRGNDLLGRRAWCARNSLFK